MVEQTADYEFGKELRYLAILVSEDPVKSALIVMQVDGEPEMIQGSATVEAIDDAHYEVRYTHDLSAQPVLPFSDINYYYHLTFRDGSEFNSPKYSLHYDDNRFDWQKIEDGPFRINWFDQTDSDFGKTALQIANAGLERANSLIDGNEPTSIVIYAYPNAASMQDALNQAGQNWIVGHADPRLGVMLVSLPARPDQKLLMEQMLPHELMHILLYDHTGEGYARLPVWLNEGLASISELNPNPDYPIILNNGFERENLIPMSILCQTFPREASSALLAYAQSASFTRYLHQNYGAEGLQKLVGAYASGSDCETGTQVSIGISLSELERDWRIATFGEESNPVIARSIFPWVALMGLVLITPLAVAAIFLIRRPVQKHIPQ